MHLDRKFQNSRKEMINDHVQGRGDELGMTGWGIESGREI